MEWEQNGRGGDRGGLAQSVRRLHPTHIIHDITTYTHINKHVSPLNRSLNDIEVLLMHTASTGTVPDDML